MIYAPSTSKICHVWDNLVEICSLDKTVIFTMQIMILCNELVFALAMTLYSSFNNNSLNPWSVLRPKQNIFQVELSLYGKFLCVGATFFHLKERKHFQSIFKLCFNFLQPFSSMNNNCFKLSLLITKVRW